jgi:hypothetical protein
LDYIGFDDEIEILDNYLRIFSGELAKSGEETTRIVEQVEWKIVGINNPPG